MEMYTENSKSEDVMKNLAAIGFSGKEKPHTNGGAQESCVSLHSATKVGKVANGKAETKQGKKTAKGKTKIAAKKKDTTAKAEGGGLDAALEALINNQRQPKLWYADESLGIRYIDVCHAAEQEHLGLSGLLGLNYADRFAAEMGSDGKLLYYYYDGGLWKKDAMGLRFEGDKYLLDLLAQAIRFLYANKEHIDEDDIEDLEKVLEKGLKLVRNPKSYKTILERATVGQKGLIVPSEKWDNDLDQLTTPEGKLVLSTGEVQPLTPTDYRRRCTGVGLFDETLLPPEQETLWWRTLRKIFLWYRYPGEFTPDPGATAAENKQRQLEHEAKMQKWRSFEYADEAIRFFQKLLGYCLFGRNRQHKFIIFMGQKGRNGKGLVLHLLQVVLGHEYVKETRQETFVKVRNTTSSGSATPDLVALKGARIVVVEETEHGAAINASFLKRFTGGDEMSGRGLYKDEETFKPTGVHIFATNHLPYLDSDDNALHARAIIVPFLTQFGENVGDTEESPYLQKQDPDLQERLMGEADVILAFLAKGAKIYHDEQSLNIPEEFKRFADEFRRSRDTLQMFIEECCSVGKGHKIILTQLFEAFSQWQHAGKMKCWTRALFKERILAKGYTVYKSNTDCVKCIALKKIDDVEIGEKSGDAHIDAFERRHGYRSNDF